VAVGEELDGLWLRYEYRDTDGTGQLSAEARYGGFAGVSWAWFSDDALLSFAERLLTRPLGDAPIHISGGTGGDDRFEEHVGLTVAMGMRGQVALVAHLATSTNPEENPGSSRSEARVEVLTSYGALQRFSTGLRQLVSGASDVARLDAVIPH